MTSVQKNAVLSTEKTELQQTVLSVGKFLSNRNTGTRRLKDSFALVHVITSIIKEVIVRTGKKQQQTIMVLDG
jgi:hypothetical protein